MLHEDQEHPLTQLRRKVIERLATWSGSLAPKTCEAYEASLRLIAATLGEESATGIFVRLVVAPSFVHEQLTAFAADGEGKSNTRRRHLAALNSAHRALVDSGIELPRLRVLMPERDVKLECIATTRGDLRAVEVFLARQPGKREKRTAAAIALAGVALRAHDIVSLRFAQYSLGRIAVAGSFVDLPQQIDATVQQWWEIAEVEVARPFELTTRSLQRDVAELADDMAPTLTLEGVRRRAIVDAYLAGGAYAAAAFARKSNPSEVRRFVEADGLKWNPDRRPPALARGPAPGSLGRGRSRGLPCS